ncbi:MAG TPA: hypothetical protein VN660_09155 [Steroidobacteraceae bacterium]|nr:hypothetical protein [Steroidobacteraceae bacterium]
MASASVLTLVLGSLYLGWYHWPGWYLADARSVVLMLIGIDLTLGPLLTLVVARSTKPRAELVRDIGIIASVQLCALVYGAGALWSGRPLYYAFSENVLQLVQASDFSAQQLDRARHQHAALRPHWYSLPRWIWAPLPANPDEAQKIVMSAVDGGDDVIDMPGYFKQWSAGEPALRKQLKPVAKVAYFSGGQKEALGERMRALGLDPNQANAIPLTGRGPPLLVVFDPASLQMRRILTAPASHWVSSQRSSVRRVLQSLLPHKPAATAALKH